jgi:hypothetical protein
VAYAELTAGDDAPTLDDADTVDVSIRGVDTFVGALFARIALDDGVIATSGAMRMGTLAALVDGRSAHPVGLPNVRRARRGRAAEAMFAGFARRFDARSAVRNRGRVDRDDAVAHPSRAPTKGSAIVAISSPIQGTARRPGGAGSRRALASSQVNPRSGSDTPPRIDGKSPGPVSTAQIGAHAVDGGRVFQ